VLFVVHRFISQTQANRHSLLLLTCTSVSMKCRDDEVKLKTFCVQEVTTSFSSQISICSKTRLCAFIGSARRRKFYAKPKPLKCITTWRGTLNMWRTLWPTGGLRCGKPVLFFFKSKLCQIAFIYRSRTLNREKKMDYSPAIFGVRLHFPHAWKPSHF